MAAQPNERPWLDEASALYATGKSLRVVAAHVGIPYETARHAFKRAGIPVRTPQEAVKLRRVTPDFTIHPTEDRLLTGTNGHLSRGIARIEAAIVDDMTRNGSAFTDGGK
jgi:hypothetical protein